MFSRSQRADEDTWLVFTIQESQSASQQSDQLRAWLETNKPSKVTRQSGVGWISVKRGSEERRVKSSQAKAEWETEGERTMETVNHLASKFGDTGSKWMFHV